MQITNVSQNSLISRKKIQNQNGNVSFKAAYIPTTKHYAADEINKQVAEFNQELLPKILPMARRRANAAIRQVHKALGITKAEARVKSASSLATDFDCFVLAGGPGSRFKALSDPIGSIRGAEYNKISTPFAINEKTPDFTMATPILALGSIFAAGTKKAKKAAHAVQGKAAKAKGSEKVDVGYKPYTKTEEFGNFWHIVDHYTKNPKEIKDVVLLSGDNNFDIKSGEFLRTVVRMKEEGHHLAAFGVKKSPAEVARNFGVIGATTPQRAAKDILALTEFTEKPPIEIATKMAQTSGGINIANTGCLVISKEAMTKIVKTVRREKALQRKLARDIEAMGPKATPGMKNLAKNGFPSTFSRFDEHGNSKITDRYDFSTAQAWILNNMYKPKDVQAGKGPIVHMLPSEKWSDLGNPKAMFNEIKDIIQGKFTQNLPKQVANDTQKALAAKSHLADDGAQKALVVTNKYASLAEVPHDVMEKAHSVEGVKIIG